MSVGMTTVGCARGWPGIFSRNLHRISVFYKPAVYRPSFLVLYAPRPRCARVVRFDFASFVLGYESGSLFARNEDHLFSAALPLPPPSTPVSICLLGVARFPRFLRRLLRDAFLRSPRESCSFAFFRGPRLLQFYFLARFPRTP